MNIPRLTSCLCVFVVQLTSIAVHAQDTAGRLLRTDSRAGYTHHLTLYDRAGQAINPDEKNAKPYSPKITCGKCHEYGLINHGWHFNAGLPEEPDQTASSQPSSAPSSEQSAPSSPSSLRRSVASSLPPSGRPGEPWMYTDPDTGTQLPLSYRDWPGTFRPANVGLTPWKFVQLFGRHLPGGGIFDPDPNALAQTAPGEAHANGDSHSVTDQHEAARWKISGGLEIDCMVCHAASGSGYDAGEIARQVARENLAWIPTATLGLGVVRGDAKKLPDDFDPDMASDNPDRRPPEVAYNKSLFDADQRVFFDIVKDPPAERCYFCHSVREVGQKAVPAWQHEGDVHLAAGLRCSDCHNNGIEHAPYGYARSARSCAGCHLGSDEAFELGAQSMWDAGLLPRGSYPLRSLSSWPKQDPIEPKLGGIFRAPHPAHVGLPPLHLEKLECAACHSASWPQADPTSIQTSLGHALGVSTKERRDEDSPKLFEPIFARPGKDVAHYGGTIEPYKATWPAYFAKRNDDKLAPLPVDAIQKAAKKNAQRSKKKTESRGPLTDDEIVLLLKPLTAQFAKDTTKETRSATKDQIGYLRDGNFYTLAEGDKLQRETLATERPYLWPLAHDVRPARQALGARGCTDCHAHDSPMFFGSLAATAQLPNTPLPIASMDQLIGYDKKLAADWADSFAWRTTFKWASFICLAIATLALLRRLMLGLVPTLSGNQQATTVRPENSRRSLRDLLWSIFSAIFMISVFVEVFTLWGHPLAGRALRIHMLAAAPFVVAFAGIACFAASSRARIENLPVRVGARFVWWLVTFFMILAIVGTGAILLAMLPVFGTGAQQSLIAWHGSASNFILPSFAFAMMMPELIRFVRAGMGKKD